MEAVHLPTKQRVGRYVGPVERLRGLAAILEAFGRHCFPASDWTFEK